MQSNLLGRGIPLPSDAHDRLVAQYDGGIAYQDASFARLIGWLKQRGLYDKALIIITGDHGEAFGERGLMDHGVGVHEDQVHIPLLVKYPFQTAASVVTAPVSHVDLLPTILDMLGYPIPSYLQGRSLRNPAGLERRTIYAESFFPSFHRVKNQEFNRVERAVRIGSLKLIASTSGSSELYDLAKDPNELHNLNALDQPGARDLETALHGWVRSCPYQRRGTVGRREQGRNEAPQGSWVRTIAPAYSPFKKPLNFFRARLWSAPRALEKPASPRATAAACRESSAGSAARRHRADRFARCYRENSVSPATNLASDGIHRQMLPWV